MADVDRDECGKLATLLAKGLSEGEVCKVLKLSRRRYQFLCRMLQRSAEDKAVVWGKFTAATLRNIRRLDALAERAMATTVEVDVKQEDGSVKKVSIPNEPDPQVAYRCISEIQKIEERRIELGQGLGVYPSSKDENKKSEAEDFLLSLFLSSARERLMQDHGKEIPQLTRTYEVSKLDEVTDVSDSVEVHRLDSR